MQKRSLAISRKYYMYRRKTLEERPKLIKEFLERLVEAIGEYSTIVVFGGRGDPRTLYSSEPRDLDVLVITTKPVEEVEEKIYKLKPRRLPVDIVVIDKEHFNREDPLFKQMLRRHIVVHDRLGVMRKLDRARE